MRIRTSAIRFKESGNDQENFIEFVEKVLRKYGRLLMMGHHPWDHG